ncbi:MAG: ribonuclease III, partial [Dehalococcoidia bacterium]
DFDLGDYERLEYLGDAFLGWVVADELYARYPGFGEGDLTRARASLVNGKTLAEVAARLNLGRFLWLGQGEEASGGRERRSTLAAVVEAVVGAVLLDRGEKQARRLVLKWLGERLNKLDDAGAPRDAKSSLQEMAQQNALPLPTYEVLSETGPAHAKTFTVRVLVDGVERGRGSGPRKADAEQAAAAQANETLLTSES